MRRKKADPVIGQEVTWTEDGHELAGQVWAPCPEAGPGSSIVSRYGPDERVRYRETATHGPGRLYWIVTPGGREFRTASYDPAAGTFTVGYWIWDSRGLCVRDGKAAV
jgi:hypothetical protein